MEVVLFSMLLSCFYLIRSFFYCYYFFFQFSPEGGLLVVIMLNSRIFKLYKSFIGLRNRKSSKIILLNLVFLYMDLHRGS